MKVTMGLEVPVASPTPKNTKQKDKDFNEIFSECKGVSKQSRHKTKDSNQQMKSVIKKSTELKETSINLNDKDNAEESIQMEGLQEKEKEDVITQILNMLQNLSQNVQFVPQTINHLESYVKEDRLSVKELQDLLSILQKLQNQLNVSLDDFQVLEDFQPLEDFKALEDYKAQIEQFTMVENSETVQTLKNDKVDDAYTDSDFKLIKEFQLDDVTLSKLTGKSFEIELDIQSNENAIEVQVQKQSIPLEEVIKENDIAQQTTAINIQGGNLDTNNTLTSISQRLTLTPQQLNDAVLNQIKDKIQIHVGEQISEIKMQLRPEHLGNVSLKMEMERGALTAKFIVESQQVKEIIESQFNTLRDVLSKQGIDVRQVTVSVGQDDLSQHQEMLHQQKQNSKKIHRKISVRELMEIYGEEVEEEMTLSNSHTDHQVDYSA